MRTAVIMPGHLRTFAINYPNHRWMLHRHLGELDFYIATEPDERHEDWKVLLQHHPADRIHVVYLAPPDGLVEPDPTLDQFAPYPRTMTRQPGLTNNQSLMRALWGLARMGDHILDRGRAHDYDQFMLCRGDFFIHHFDPPRVTPRENECFISWYGNYGGATGIGLFGWRALAGYLHTHDRLNELLAAGCPLHPECLVAASMELNHAVVNRTLAIEWSKRTDPVPQPNGTAEVTHHVSHPYAYEVAAFTAALSRGERGTPYL